jgi:hypothetical protein
MSQALEILHLTEDTFPPGGFLARVDAPRRTSFNALLRLDEKVAVREASLLTPRHPDFVFFRRYADGRSSQVAAYVVDNTDNHVNAEELAELHRHIWLSGHTPLLYMAETGRVDIYACAIPAARGKGKDWRPRPVETIRCAADITDALKAKRYSAFRLVDGTFWEDPHNAHLVNLNKSAQQGLIDKVKYADKKLDGRNKPAARHLLLLTLLLKYLEDREVFPQGWFEQFHPGSPSCLHVFKHGGKQVVLRMFQELENRFNGDIFSIAPEHERAIDDALLGNLADCVCENLDSKTGQFYLWEYYSFKHIPVEVLSHIYQQFAEEGKGAVFTPPKLVDLLLDQIMPLASLRGDETVLDPACGSGVFLVAAFRRLVHVWCEKRQWRRPTPAELTKLLSRTIFGIEWQDQAAELTAFSLALAVCDALQPKIIYDDLRFKKLLGHNLFIGDYARRIDEVKAKATRGRGFDSIIGNPPFLSKLTTLMQERAQKYDYDIPGKQAAYFFLLDCAKQALADAGRLCLLQNAGFLYNKNTGSFRRNFFNHIQTDGILDFVSIRGLFKGADTKVVAVLATNTRPEPGHTIEHWTFRRTFAADRLISYDLDYYDYHEVSAEDATTEESWPWRANLLGGGRLFHLARRLARLPTLRDAVRKHGWRMGEGYKDASKPGSPATPDWMFGKKLLPTSAFTKDDIDTGLLSTVAFENCQAPREERLYHAPLILLKEHDSLPCFFWNDGFLVYPHTIIGIASGAGDTQNLKAFADRFIQDHDILRASCQLLGTRLLISKATAPTKAEIDRLPWPEDGNWRLAPWEKEMLEDITHSMAEYVRLGQDSDLLKNPLRNDERKAYADTFLRLVRRIFPEAAEAGQGREVGLRYQAFRLKGNALLDWSEQGWAEGAGKIVFASGGDTGSSCSIRLLRLYIGDILVLVKPDRPRYWLRSIAIRDADDTLADIMREDEPGA